MTDPLTPPECDLRGYEYMPLFGQRMFGSRFYSLALRQPRAGLAAMKLWWEAWTQCPAGSLPDDEFDLARMADFGTDLKSWHAVKEIALYGFVKCSDGRLYHPIICTEALSAWERRKRDRARKAEQRAKRTATGGGSPQGVPRDKPGTECGTDSGTGDGSPRHVLSDRTGQDRSKKDPVLRTDAAGATSPDARAKLWTEGVPIVRRLTGMPESRTRTLVGKLLKPMRDDCAGLLAVLREAQDTRPVDPVPWLIAAAQARSEPRGNARKSASDAFMAEWLGDFDAPQSDTPRLQ